MTPLVSQLWPQFMADPDFAACFGRVVVEHAQMLRQERQVIFTLRSSALLDKGLCARLLASLAPDYEGFELRIHNLFGYAALDESGLRELMEEMKRDGVPINGFLDRCRITITGQNITIGVCHGTKFLQEMQFERLLAERIAAHTGVKPKVTLESSVGEAEQRQMEEKLERKIAPPVVKFERKNTAPSIKVEGLDLTDKPVTIFHGKMFSPKNLTPLKDLGGEGGKCMIWGDVFFTEVKGSFRKIYTVSITDYTGSYTVKIFDEKENAAKVDQAIKDGMTVLVRGSVSYDKYFRDYAIRPLSIMSVQKEKKMDDAPVKRVELHLHTKMSAMDGISDCSALIKRAAEWGHKAVAITDHGVAQAFPEAMNTAAATGIKVIYGVEGYFVNDMVPIVTGREDTPFDGEFIVFDIETTGFNAQDDRITEIGAVRVKGGKILDSFDTFANPEMPIPARITELTGITDEMVSADRRALCAVDAALLKEQAAELGAAMANGVRVVFGSKDAVEAAKELFDTVETL